MAGPTEMSSYRLSPHAEEDLHEIARYTADVWGVEQAQRYATALERCFLSIAAGTAVTREPIPSRPELRVCRCEHHFVFSLIESAGEALIIAVLHEKMDLMVRLRDRLGGR